MRLVYANRPREIRLKALLLAALPAFATAAWLTWLRPQARGAAGDWLQQVLGNVAQFLRFLAALLGVPEAWVRQAVDVLLGPALPLFTALVVLALTWPLLAMRLVCGRPLVDWLWPAFPAGLDGRLARQAGDEADPIDPLNPETPFLGRDEEMNQLRLFAGPKAGTAAILQLCGREGIGKTRLAIEWLRFLREHGWDAGLLPPETSPGDLRALHLRRDTAIVIDEAGLRGDDLWPLVDAILRKVKRHRLRILLVDQVPLDLPQDMPRERRTRIGKAWQAGAQVCGEERLRLPRLSEETIERLAPDLSPAARRHADGRPLYALLGEHPEEECRRRAERRLKRARNEEERALLALAALAGPLDHGKRRTVPGLEKRVNVRRLQHLFEGEPRATLRRMLPALRPEGVASELLLQVLADWPQEDTAHFAMAAMRTHPQAALRRLAHLTRWPLAPEREEEYAALRRMLWQWLEEALPDWKRQLLELAEELHAEIAAFYEALDEHPPTTPTAIAARVRELQALLQQMTDIADLLSFDAEMALLDAEAQMPATAWFGGWGRFDLLEQAGQRVLDIATRFSDDAAIAEEAAKACTNAIGRYGKAGRFDDVARWEQHLLALMERFPDDAAIAEWMASAGAHAIINYGADKRFNDVVRWERHLRVLMERFPDDAAIAVVVAKACTSAITRYGEAGRFDDVARWEQHLLAVQERFPDDAAIAEWVAIAGANAIADYGAAKRFDDVARWEQHLLAVQQCFPDDAAIAEAVARACHNALIGLPGGEDWQRWHQRLAQLARQFPTNLTIQEQAMEHGVSCLQQTRTPDEQDDPSAST